jgi:hypothetical protein
VLPQDRHHPLASRAESALDGAHLMGLRDGVTWRGHLEGSRDGVVCREHLEGSRDRAHLHCVDQHPSQPERNCLGKLLTAHRNLETASRMEVGSK